MKRIRLTEGQLHRLIEQTLNELDWKTYMNAAKEAQDCIQDDPFYDEDATDADFANYNKNYSRVPIFIDAARDSYQKKYDSERKDSFESYDLKTGKGINPYNYERTYGDDYGENEELPDGDFWRSQTQTFFPKTEDIPNDDFTDTDLTVRSRYGEQNDWAVYDEPYRNVVDTDDREVNLSKTSPEFRDVYNYRHGNSKYTKGKGWNESVARRVTESVMKRINEGCITEDCPIDDKTLQYWSELIDRNDHTQCNLSIAQYFNMPKYVDFYENLLRIRDGQGYLDGYQAMKANRVYNEMMNEIANKYGEDCANLIKRL